MERGRWWWAPTIGWGVIFSAIISTALIALFSFVLMVLFGVGAGLWLHK